VADDDEAPAGDAAVEVIREVLSVAPGGCSWLTPVTGRDGTVTDYRVAAVSGRTEDIYHRGSRRVGGLLSELYPSMVGGQLWETYGEVLRTGLAARLPDFRYEEKRAGVVAASVFDVTVHRLFGGLLVWWHRLDENQLRLERTELLGSLGWAEYDLTSGRTEWSPGMYRIFGRDPALGPMTRAEQAATLLPDDRGVTETAWQTLDSGAASDVTVRFRAAGSVRYLRVLSDVARDADGTPLKVYAVAQDVTAREDSRTAIQRLSDQLHTREMTALAEHRLAGQLQNLIQPVHTESLDLSGLEVTVGYVPAERVVRVGGDWYHAQTLPDGQVLLAVGDVAGHGLEAASGMAHLRFALVAWLSIGLRDPGVLLGHMNRLCRQLDITATAIIGRYDPATRVLSWARAGHLPPLLARAGAIETPARPAGLLLGADGDAAYPVLTEPLHPGDLLLLYTDGLVERRSPEADLLDQVAACLAAASAAPDGPATGRLHTLLQQANPDDDTCTVLVRVGPPCGRATARSSAG
jgi:serine phosphatase RsbU (regulator of sigma subunit)